ncbi:MAG TPA: protease pro-enzyme activation domain-containing protein [Candidatus Acidoferrales bacterium]|nr:protease pro-enzyme activation domain-containing protein [Candidatus Acidoferrales bacterium]
MQADLNSKWAFFKNAALIALVLTLAVKLSSRTVDAQQATGCQLLHGHVPPAIARLHLNPLFNIPETNQLRLAISLPLQNESALGDLLKQIYDPGNPNYHHYLTPGQFTAQFGPSQQDYDAVVQFFRSNGLAVIGTYSNRTLIDVTGNVGNIERTFHTTLRVYRHPVENRTFFSPDTDPVINLGVPIKHVDGLDNFIIPKPAIRPETPMTSHPGAQPALGSGPSGEYMGPDFHAAYAPGVALNGAGQVVGLFELDAYVSNDIAFYERTNGLPIVPLTNVTPDGSVHRTSSGSEEVSLDIEMAVSMATNLSKVIVYEAPNGGATSVPDLLNRIASDNIAKQISSSWLIGDSSSYDTYYQQMAAQGQSFFQASGDNGAYYSGISEWADDTNITLVGGTTLSTTGPSGAWSSETVWNWYSTGQGNGGSGGGVNFNSVSIPAWQKFVSMANNQGSTTLRNVPDVAMTGDNIYVVYNNAHTQDVGGTSCAAPLWAAFAALVNQQALAKGETTVGFINPAVYDIGLSANYENCFHDITTGNNTNTTVGNEYFATNGYDLCTGWGTPTGSNLINALTAPPITLTITPNTGFNATGLPGGPFAPASQVYSLTNIGGSSFKWSLGNTSSWLVASITNGTLAAGKGTNVTISVSANADTLGGGTYPATVTFTNISSNYVESLQFTLDVTESLIVAPAAGFNVSGAEGGPFTATSEDFTLTNSGAVSLNWQAAGPVWLNLSPSNGTLGVNSATPVTAILNPGANSLGPGAYTGQVAFTDNNSGIVQNRPFILSIGQNIVLNGGFETGDFTDWTLNTNGVQGDTIVDNGGTGISPHAGNYYAAFGQNGSLGYISQALPTVASQSYLLSLWLNSPNVADLPPTTNLLSSNTPNQFVVSWNGVTQYNQTNLPPINGWTNMQFIVTATGPGSVLQFGQMDDQWYLGLDDVNVWPIPAPNIQSFSREPGSALSLSWNTLTNIEYQVQYSTNLASTNWFNLNDYSATGPILTVTNSIGTNPAIFYRVLQLP